MEEAHPPPEPPVISWSQVKCSLNPLRILGLGAGVVIRLTPGFFRPKKEV